jgi:hypothetical protein
MYVPTACMYLLHELLNYNMNYYRKHLFIYIGFQNKVLQKTTTNYY